MPLPSSAASTLDLLPFIGMYISGDLAEWTIYTTRRGKIVAYPRTAPTTAPTFLQLQQRQRFRYAQALWMLESAITKAAWETLVKRNSLDMTGQNAYISLSLSPDPTTLTTLNRKAGLNLTIPKTTPQ